MDTEALSSICGSLGYRREDEDGTLLGYVKGDYCMDNLKDLQRFLRRDDPHTREVFKQTCKWNVVSRDLIPLMENYQNDRNLLINGVKVLVFLTMPIDPASDSIAQQIEYLWHIKAVITRHVIVGVIVALLEDPLDHLERNIFTEDDWMLVQLVLTFFRNVLAIQDILSQHKASGSSTHFLHLRDTFLEILFQENGHDPKLIAESSREQSEDAVIETSLNSLKYIMEEEQQKTKLVKLRNSAICSRFSGTFTRLTMDGSRTLCKGDPTTASGNSLLQTPQVQRGPLKKIAWDKGNLVATRSKISSLLRNFLDQFLTGAYNVLMQSACEDIEKDQHEIQTSDIIIFYHVAYFVTNFQHHRLSVWKPECTDVPEEFPLNTVNDKSTFHGDICGPISATMHEAMFSLVITKWRYAFESLKETNDYKLLSSSGSIMKSMICMLDLVLTLSPEDSKEHQTARILLYKLFYDQTDQGMTYFLLNLIKCFDTHKQPKSDLADLVEIIHRFLELMERLQQCGTLREGEKKESIIRKQACCGKRPNQLPDSMDNADDVRYENVMSCPDSAMRKEETDRDPPSTEDLDIHHPDGPNTAVDSDLGHKRVRDDPDDQNYVTEEDSDDDHQPETNEVDLSVSNVLINFANNAIIQRLCWLLRFYKSNPENVNNYVINMLQRISDDLELSPMLYQLSVLTIFYSILVDQKSSKCKQYAIVFGFLTKLVRRMFKKLKNQPLLFVELLLWKTRKECHCIDAEKTKGISDDGRAGSIAEMGVGHSRSIADSLGEDEADILTSRNLYQHNAETLVGNIQADVIENQRAVLTSTENFVNNTEKIDNQRFEADPQCDRLTDDAQDSHREVSPVQMSSKLKQFGVSTGRKRRSIRKSSVDEDDQVNGNCDSVSHSGTMGLDDPSSNVRKRIRAFSKDQEQIVRDLFDKFKDHKRCAHMIANALDPSAYTAAQVSRKLRQLGLAPQGRKPRKGSNDSGTTDLCEKEDESEEEMLATLLQRCKGKKGRPKHVETGRPEAAPPPEAGSDGDLSGPMLGSARAEPVTTETAAVKKHKSSSWVMGGELEDSGDELSFTSPRNITSRRKLRTFIDGEADE
ncbi:unnamed protein product [Spirodela intermedia]|uniref:Timeless N-terminal domain-containing protein n=1 Tax=Spirodela intermedia TaxID=51605 RepID=A0A7I8J791_SPIIN|nr:unnamed protein product [Spirodela intermedia]CAA6665934.1 unnamed protein product [Spirodela intermedia]